MPTGYTAELMEKGLPFRTFVLQCARAMGACVMQRDDPMSEPPQVREPSDYHTKAVQTTKDALRKFQAMTPEEQTAHGTTLRDEAVKSRGDMLVRDREANARLEAMRIQVQAWCPPTDEHAGLKDFMLEQIKISRNDLAWATKYFTEAEEKTPEAYFVEAVSRAVHDVAYHEKGLREEGERTGGRNKWITDLYASLPSDGGQR